MFLNWFNFCISFFFISCLKEGFNFGGIVKTIGKFLSHIPTTIPPTHQFLVIFPIYNSMLPNSNPTRGSSTRFEDAKANFDDACGICLLEKKSAQKQNSLIELTVIQEQAAAAWEVFRDPTNMKLTPVSL